MSTRETAYQIFEQLNEEQLKGFIAMFREIYPVKDDEQKIRDEAFETLESLRRSVPDFDEKRALEEYREEKYQEYWNL